MRNVLSMLRLALKAENDINSWYRIERVYNCESDRAFVNKTTGVRVYGTGNYRLI